MCTALQLEPYRVKSWEDFSHTGSSAVLPLTSLYLARLPSLPAGSAFSPAVLRRGAAPGQSCLSQSAAHLLGAPSVPGARPSSGAEDQPKASLSLPLLGSLQMSQLLKGSGVTLGGWTF